MNKQLVNPDSLYQSQYYTQAIVSRGGTTIHISGQWAYNAQGEVQHEGDLTAQAVLACRNLKSVLKHAGATPDDVVKVNVYIANYKMANLDAVEAGFTELFGEKREFASTLIGVQSLALDGMLYEIEAVAVLSQ